MSVARRRALFREGDVPPGGTCLSSFLVVSRGDEILVGRMAKPEVWVERFFVSQTTAVKFSGSGKYVLPARHLAWYESPIAAAESILREQIGLPLETGKVRLLDVQSHLGSDLSAPEKPPHWDICFLYEARASHGDAKRLTPPEWFEELASSLCRSSLPKTLRGVTETCFRRLA